MAGSKEVSFTPREMEVLALAWQCMDTQPKVCIPSPRTLYPLTAHFPSTAALL